MSVPDAPGRILALRLRPRDDRALARAAKRRGLPISTYIREVAVAQARAENTAHRQVQAIRRAAVEVADEGAI